MLARALLKLLAFGLRVLGALMVVCGGLFFAGAKFDRSDAHRSEYALVGIVLVAVGTVVAKGGRKVASRSASAALAEDPRPPVVYLRTFRADRRAARSVQDGWLRRLIPMAIPTSTATEEEQLAKVLSRLGPVIAIGRPTEALPQLGAARAYALEDAWQKTVLEWLDVAALVVLRVGESYGIRWELEQCVQRLPNGKLVILTPSSRKEYDRFQAWAQPLFRLPLPEFRDGNAGLSVGGVLRFDDGGARLEPVRVTAVQRWARLDEPFVSAFHTALAQGLSFGEPAQAAPSWRRLVAGAVDVAAIASGLAIATAFAPPEAAAAIPFLGALFGTLLWFTAFEAGAGGRTPGKWLLGIRVVDSLGYAPTPWQAFLRALAKVMAVPFAVVVPIMSLLLWRPYYDAIAQTRVVRTARPAQRSARRAGPVSAPDELAPRPDCQRAEALVRGPVREMVAGLAILIAAVGVLELWGTFSSALFFGGGILTLHSWARLRGWLFYTLKRRPAFVLLGLALASPAPLIVALCWADIVRGFHDEAPLSGRYIDQGRHYSLEFPPGWTRRPHDPYSLWAYAPPTNPRFPYARNVGVIANHRSGVVETLDQYFAHNVDRVSQFPGFHEVTRGATTVAGRDARFIVYDLVGGPREEIVIRTSDFAYILIGEAFAEDWESFAPVFESIAASFRIESAAKK